MSGLAKKLFFAVLGTLMVSSIYAQTVKGVVRDSEGNTLPGVSVIIDGTSTGTVTDASGAYRIDVKDSASTTLQFTMIGMKTVLESVNGRKTINVSLEEDKTYLDEVVVVGYQEMKRKDLLGSVASVSNEKLVEMPVATVGEALAGRMAGVSVVATEGSADADIKIRVRGTGSITQSSEPLYIIDGYPADDLSEISASQIQSIDVLKDAFATAIYGSRGANGVVIVTTKKAGGAEKVRVDLNAYFGIKTMANKSAYSPMNAGEFVRAQYEMSMLRNSGTLPGSYLRQFGAFNDLDLYDGLPVNDYIDQVFGNTGTNYNVDLSVSGRTKASNWSLTLARVGENGIMTGSSFDRTNVGFNANVRTSRHTSLDFRVRYSLANTRGGAANNINDFRFSAQNGRVNQCLAYSPIPLHNNVYGEDDDTSYAEYRVHPLRSVRDNDMKLRRHNLNISGAFNWEIIKNLKLKLDFGMQDNSTDRQTFIGSSTYWSNIYSNYPGMPANRSYAFSTMKLRNANTLTYDFKEILNPAVHKLNIVVGEELNFASSQAQNIVVEGFPDFFTSEDAWNFTASAQNTFLNERVINQNDVLLSFFGRVNYTLFDRYSIGGTVRADGSSRFGVGHRWGVFPSVALSWDISKEPFMQGTSFWLNQLKLRGSYGTAGNNGVPSGEVYPVYSAASTNVLATATSIWRPSDNLPNENLTWETARTGNVGLDFSFIGGKINGSLEYYNNLTDDLLIRFPISGTGYKYQYQNRASIQNQGVEFSLNLPLVRKRNFDLSISGNIAYNVNKVLSIGGMDNIKSSTNWASTQITYDYMVTTGQPLGNVYGYEVEGIYQVDDFEYNGSSWALKDGLVDETDLLGKDYFRPGSVKIKDQDHNNRIDEDDMVKIGNTLPKITGGFSINAFLFGVDISANFNFMAGNDVYNANRLTFTNSRFWNNVNLSNDVNLSHRWTSIDWTSGQMFTDAESYAEANRNATIWSPMMQKAVCLDYGIEDGSFLRLQSATIGYSFPERLISRIHMRKLRVYVTGSNLFCLTRYSGYDPEVDCRRSTPLTPGCDFSAYPKSIGVVFGVNVGF